MSTNPYLPRYLHKQNEPSLNYPTTPHPFSVSFSPSPSSPSALKRTLQHQQIQDLQHKCELILNHNETLLLQNAQLKQRLAQAQAVGAMKMQKMSRYQAQDQEFIVRKIKLDLQHKTRQCQVLVCELDAVKQATFKQNQSLRTIINNLTGSNQQSKLQNVRLSQQILSIRQQAQSDRKIAVKDAQRRAKQQLTKIQKINTLDLARQRTLLSKTIQQHKMRLQQQRIQSQNRQNTLINKLQDNHNRQIEQLRGKMVEQFEYQLRKLEEEATERCRNQRDKAQNFIKESLVGLENAAQAENQVLRQEIRALQMSLQSRKKFIQELTSSQLQTQRQLAGMNQFIQLRKRMKEEVQHLMRQNEMLKIKTAEKYQRDLKEMVRVYDDKIEILAIQIKTLIQQNDRLRRTYQQQIQSKLSSRRAHQIQIAQLKNTIRKLRVQIQASQDEYRLNIDGLRQQNMTLSMTMMKFMIDVKEKANFFEDQNRKLRALYNKHEAEVELQKKQAEEKVSYFQGKVAHLQKMMDDQKADLVEKEELLSKSFEEKERMLRNNLKKEREIIDGLIADTEQQNDQLKAKLKQSLQNYLQLQLDLKQSKEQSIHLTNKIKDLMEHIQRLRMQVQMAGTQDRQKDQALESWKKHYQQMILNLEGDKKSLRQMLDGQAQKLERMVYKYRIMQEELKKAGESIRKKGELDRRVVELGMDQNLVKNAAELWHKNN